MSDSIITTTVKNPELAKEILAYELKEAEKTIQKCNELLTADFGLSFWQEGGYLAQKAVAIETRNFLNNIAFALEPDADMSGLNGYCLQIFRQYVTTEVERSTAFTRELEYEAKREAYKKQLRIMVSLFNLDCKETITAAMWL